MRSLRLPLTALAALLSSSCCSSESGGDLSWLGGVIGGILGFGLFFLVTYLTLRNRS
jgi:hypothetical protein